MANTEAYKQFLTQAKDAGLLKDFSAQELQTAYDYPEFGYSLLGLKQDYYKSTTDEGKTLAHEAANQLRAKYGEMSKTDKLTKKTAAPVSTGKKTDYQETLAKIEKQTYDNWKEGSAYKELEGDYTERGQKAMQDTLAELSARTGGIASSYAGGAAQGAYNEYMDGLEDAAYNRYLGETDALYALLSAQRQAEETEYSRMLDQLQLERQAEALAYERQQDAEGISFERNLLEREEARNTVDKMIAMGATLTDIPAELLTKSGYSQSYVTVGNADYKRQTAPKVTGGIYEPAAPVYGETLSQGQVSELLSKYGKNKTLTADEWDALGRMGYTLDYESGKIVHQDATAKNSFSIDDIIKLYDNEFIDEETAKQMLNLVKEDLNTENGATPYSFADEKLQIFAANGNEDAMWEVLDGYLDFLSEEEVARLMKKYGLE